MGRLHEVLAVEGQLKEQAAKARQGLGKTFESKRHLFEEKLSTFASNVEGVAPVTEQQCDIQTTVAAELAWLTGLLSPQLDISLQVAEANTRARGDVVLEDGTVLARDLPATALLELEKRAAEVQELVNKIPTLDPTKSFTPDTERGNGIYQARPVTKVRRQKMQKPIVLFPATVEHPAQTQLISEDVPVGTLTEQEWSGLITPAQKADMLTRCEALRRAIKRARSRANEVEVNPVTGIGTVLLDFVFKT